MELTWVLDNRFLPENINKLQEALSQLGIPYFIHPERETLYPELPSSITDDSLIILYGTLGFLNNYYRKYNFQPGLITPLELICCTKYRLAIKEWLLNKLVVYATLNDIKTDFGYYQSLLGEDLFIRPNDGLKSVVGTVASSWKEFSDSNWHYLQSCYSEDLLLQVGPAYGISTEWRCFCVQGKFVTGSRYRDAKGFDKNAGVPKEVEEFVSAPAQALFNYGQEASIIDVCKSGDGLFVLEVNSPNGSGLYDLDVVKYVQGMNQASLSIIDKAK